MGNLELDPYTIYLLWEMKSILMQKKIIIVLSSNMVYVTGVYQVW